MERNIITALLVGMVIGAASAAALTPSAVLALKAQPQQGTAWSADYAAIPHDPVAREPAPTF
jgi:hypothetical protein